MPEFQGKKYPYTSSGYRQMMKDKKSVGAGMKKGGSSQKLMKGGMKKTKKKKQEVNMNLLKDLWGHLKEWNEWKLKDWIKAGILVIVILVVLKIIIVPGA